MTTAKEPTFEELISGLEQVVKRLESSDLPLEDAISTYQKGVLLAREGHARLASVERKIEALTKEGERRDLDPQAILAPTLQVEEADGDEA